MGNDIDLPDELEEENSPYEHLELTEYIRSFRISADRVRWVTFIMTFFSAVITLAPSSPSSVTPLAPCWRHS
jgi:hypothetical protein